MGCLKHTALCCFTGWWFLSASVFAYTPKQPPAPMPSPKLTISPVFPWDRTENGGCGEGCVACNADLATCGLCGPSTGLNTTGRCQPCAAQHCVECAADYMRCARCNPTMGMGVDSAGSCSACKVPGCHDCSRNASVCLQCPLQTGLSLKTTTKAMACVRCADSRCGNCTAAFDRCTTCEAGFTVDAASGRCVSCGVDNCKVCSGRDTCSVCEDGFGLNGSGACQPCRQQSGCLMCGKNYTVCEQCFGNLQVDSVNGRCRPCSDVHCANCTATGQCLQCQDFYGLSSNGTCLPCPLNCPDCRSNNTRCQRCAPFHAPSADGSSCTSCELRNVCSDYATGLRRQSNPVHAEVGYDGQCLPDPEGASWKTVVSAKGFVCAGCGPSAPAPFAISSGFFTLAEAALYKLLTEDTDLGTDICAGSRPPGPAPTSGKVASAISWCGDVASQPGFFNATYDVRFEAELTCATQPVRVGLRAFVKTIGSPMWVESSITRATVLPITAPVLPQG